ncbi:MAG: glycerophosphodiester phosphodiesterase family protein [Mariniphaga sp.]|nr:glycerophosphodiester phosphodiesterase family protein [Mariniphaga sp.]
MKILLIFLLAFLSLSMDGQQTFIAHRGASWLAPENTVTSANLAWELGADAVEIDVYLTKNNKVMVIHDNSTGRTAGNVKNYTIRDTPSRVLRKLEAGSWKDEIFRGEKIPFISEILKTVPEGKKLVVEIKAGREIIPYLRQEIKKSGKLKQVVFICFNWEVILETRKVFPDNPCYWLSSSKEEWKSKKEEVAKAGLTGVNLHYKIIDEEVMQWAEKSNLEVLTWTVNDPDIAWKLTDMGVAGITTDRPGWLKKEMGKFYE